MNNQLARILRLLVAAYCLSPIISTADELRISEAIIDQNGVRTHTVTSPSQSGPTEIHVLLPRHLDAGKKYPVLYLLPVEAGNNHRYGNGLDEARQTGLADQWNIICIAPTFADLPWYADHPTRSDLQQESYFLRVVLPAVEARYPIAAGPQDRFLVGFSKSGWGAFTLLLRHPDLFAGAAAWDAPLTMTWPSKYGSADIFGNAENFERYRIEPLLERQAPLLSGPPRLILSGYGNFQEPTQRIHAHMERLKIPHVYLDGPSRKHDWHSGWLAPAVEALLMPRQP